MGRSRSYEAWQELGPYFVADSLTKPKNELLIQNGRRCQEFHDPRNEYGHRTFWALTALSARRPLFEADTNRLMRTQANMGLNFDGNAWNDSVRHVWTV
jgi:hypothetical protein